MSEFKLELVEDNKGIVDFQDVLDVMGNGDAVTFYYDGDEGRWIEVTQKDGKYFYNSGDGSSNDIGEEELTQSKIDQMTNCMIEITQDTVDFFWSLEQI